MNIESNCTELLGRRYLPFIATGTSSGHRESCFAICWKKAMFSASWPTGSGV